jgi:hypothetical protein
MGLECLLLHEAGGDRYRVDGVLRRWMIGFQLGNGSPCDTTSARSGEVCAVRRKEHTPLKDFWSISRSNLIGICSR